MNSNNQTQAPANDRPVIQSVISRCQGAVLGCIRGMSVLLAAFVVAASCTSCQTSSPGMQIPAEAYVPRASGNLDPGDVIRVSFPGAPDLNLVQRIQANGRLSLPTVGGVQAAGRSVPALQSQLSSMYGPHLQDPTVLVSVETAASGVYVSGQVLRPGKIPLERPMTAMEAVMEAGGFSEMANLRNVVVIRNHRGQHQRYVLNMSMGGGASPPFYVNPYDVIYVSQSRW
jgi:polysaccharide biosynthesis/export protein